MNLLLLESPSHCIEPFLSKVKGYPNSSKINVNKNNYFECLKILDSPPVLTKKWLVVISPRLSSKQIASIMERDNNNVVPLSSKIKWQELGEELKELGVQYKLLDNLNPPKDVILNYIQKELNVDLDMAKYIGGRHRYHLPKVMETVTILSDLETITKKDVREYTTRFKNIWISSITENILGIDTKTSKKRLVELIYDFRYGFDYILSTVKSELELYEYVYSRMIEGELTLENYLDYESYNKKYNDLPDFKKLKMIESFDVVSYDKLYYIKTKVESIEGKTSNIYKLIKLIGGMPHVKSN